MYAINKGSNTIHNGAGVGKVFGMNEAIINELNYGQLKKRILLTIKVSNY